MASRLDRGEPDAHRGELGAPLEQALTPALSDGRLALRELQERGVVLNFWAS